MDATTLLITVYCLIDDWLAGRRLRQRGPDPVLSDSEVLTIECVGEFLGIDTDKGLYDHFRHHWRDWFPVLGRIHRTTFLRQAANLWAVKAQLRQQLLGQVSFDPGISILDSFPMPVCRFGRAYRCRRLAGLAAFGRDEGAKQTQHPALGGGQQVLGHRDRSYGARPEPGCWPTRASGCWRRHDRPGDQGPRLPRRLTQARRRIETVIGQLVERYHATRVWARNAWHLWSRWQRKLLSHTIAVYLCQQTGLGSLRFADLLTT
jgi:hypothetical protein